MKRFVKKLRRTIFFMSITFVLIGCSILYEEHVMGTEDKKPDEMIILIHGMGRTPFSMVMLDRYLKRQGYTTTSFSYSSTKYQIDTLSTKFADFLIETVENNPDKKLHIVTHSLGGIITREALVKIEDHKIPQSQNHQINIGRIVMLAPPNKGSKAANFFSRVWPIPNILKPMTELRNAKNSPINDVPIPKNVEIGIIAGRFDRKVTPEESHLHTENDHIVVNSGHTFIMNNRNVKIAVKNFLQTGHF